MFIWARFYLANSPRYATYATEKDPEQAFMTDLWKELAAHQVLLVPGAYYSPWQGEDKVTTATRGEEADVGYFRLTYAMNTVSLVALLLSSSLLTVLLRTFAYCRRRRTSKDSSACPRCCRRFGDCRCIQ